MADAIVEDNFNSYSDGPVVGQGGGWGGNNSYCYEFFVQGTTVLEGTKALHCTCAADNVIIKTGTPLSYGTQGFYFKTENREGWASGSKVEFRLMDSPGWPPNDLCRVDFKQDGTVSFLKGREVEVNFATFNDNEWIRLEMEWRANDSKARYRVNDENWTDWYGGYNSNFTYFDRVGIEFALDGGTGGVYIDALGANPVPEPSTWILLITALIGIISLNRRRLTMKTKVISLVIFLSGMLLGTTNAEPIKWDVNGHYYDTINGTFTWVEAKATAESLSYLGTQGHLATITSKKENRWITDSFNGLPTLDGRWLGGYQDFSAPDHNEPDGGWRWITGEPWDYTYWAGGEPNNSNGGEDFVSMHSYVYPDGIPWNDGKSPPASPYGFLIEYPVPEPSTIILLITGLVAGGLFFLRRK